MIENKTCKGMFVPFMGRLVNAYLNLIILRLKKYKKREKRKDILSFEGTENKRKKVMIVSNTHDRNGKCAAVLRYKSNERNTAVAYQRYERIDRFLGR